VIIFLALTIYFMRTISLQGGYLAPSVQPIHSSTVVDQTRASNAVAAEELVDNELSQAPASKVVMNSSGQSRGYLTSPSELRSIKQKADQGVEPYKSAVKNVLAVAAQSWDYNLPPVSNCISSDHPKWLDNDHGTETLYAKALAYQLTGKKHYAEEVREILERIMTNVKKVSLEANQCRLSFGWGTPELIASADLIEAYWYDQSCTGPVSTLYEDTEIGEGNCKRLFQNWLVKNPYYAVSYSATAQSNWGAAATNTTAYIADYLWDRPEVKLLHRIQNQDTSGEVLSLSPAQAYAYANRLMFDRMNGYGIEDVSSSSCDYLSGGQQNSEWAPVKSQITEKGIITEDSRRQEECNIPKYNGSYQNYPQLNLGHNIQQCELMLRRGDSSCYDNVDNSDVPDYTFVGPDGKTRSTHLYPGRGSIERAIDAIIIDSGTEWRHDSALAVAYRYYHLHHALPGVESWLSQLDFPDSCDQDICFGIFTHGFAPGETPTQEPITSKP